MWGKEEDQDYSSDRHSCALFKVLIKVGSVVFEKIALSSKERQVYYVC